MTFGTRTRFKVMTKTPQDTTTNKYNKLSKNVVH